MRLTVAYTTIYHYAEPTRRVIQLLRVTPLSFTGQNVLDWRIDVDCDAQLREGRDGYGNVTHMLYVDTPVRDLRISVAGRVLTEDTSGLVKGLAGDLPPAVFCRSTPLTEAGPALAGFAAEISGAGGSVLDRLHRLAARIHQGLRFDTEATAVETVGEEAYAAGHGVCQDFVHIFLAAARRLGIPARYISGHLLRRDGADVQPAAHAFDDSYKFVGPSIDQRVDTPGFPFDQITRQPVIYISLGTINNNRRVFHFPMPEMLTIPSAIAKLKQYFADIKLTA